MFISLENIRYSKMRDLIIDSERDLYSKGYYTAHGDQAIGAFCVKTWPQYKAAHLLLLEPWCKDWCKDVKLRDGEHIFRYTTDTTEVGGMQPLIKVNIDKGLAYFLTERSSEGLIDSPEFEKRGVKVTWMRLRAKLYAEL